LARTTTDEYDPAQPDRKTAWISIIRGYCSGVLITLNEAQANRNVILEAGEQIGDLEIHVFDAGGRVVNVGPQGDLQAVVYRPTDGPGDLPGFGCSSGLAFSCSASKRSPLFHSVKVMAAILRTSVRRAISGFMPLASKVW
jgi:hypothetical protein